MTQDKTSDAAASPNPIKADPRTAATAENASNDNGNGNGSSGHAACGEAGVQQQDNMKEEKKGNGKGYRQPCYGGPTGNGSSFHMDKAEFDKQRAKEKKYEKIGQKILDLAQVKIDGERPFDMRVNNPKLLQRVIQKGSLGLGEAFMEGWWDTTDFYSLHIFFEKILRGGIEYYFPNNAMDMANILKARLVNPQTKKKSKKVGLLHYDMGNDFFENMLGKYMQYSCGYWVTHKHESELTDADREAIQKQQEKNASYKEDEDGFVHGCNDESFSPARHPDGAPCGTGKMVAVPVTTLEEAQTTKLRMIGEKLRLRPGMEVLDVGCGWGGLALYLAEHYKVKVVGITISEEQKKNAEEMTAAFRDDITILNTDYRDIQRYYEKEKKQKNKRFDRIVSVGMFEHVGPKNYKKFFEVMRGLLNDSDPQAVMLLHTIGSKQTMESADQWYLKYIFPGGCLPAITNIGKYIENIFVMEDMHNFGYFYYLTLLAWRERFLQYWVEHQAMPANVKRRQLKPAAKSGKTSVRESAIHEGGTANPNPSNSSQTQANASGNLREDFSPTSTAAGTNPEDLAQSPQHQRTANGSSNDSSNANANANVSKDSMGKSQKERDEERDDKEFFFRMFYYYLSSSAGAFKARDLQLWQFVLSPNGVSGYPDVYRP